MRVLANACHLPDMLIDRNISSDEHMLTKQGTKEDSNLLLVTANFVSNAITAKFTNCTRKMMLETTMKMKIQHYCLSSSN